MLDKDALVNGLSDEVKAADEISKLLFNKFTFVAFIGSLVRLVRLLGDEHDDEVDEESDEERTFVSFLSLVDGSESSFSILNMVDALDVALSSEEEEQLLSVADRSASIISNGLFEQLIL